MTTERNTKENCACGVTQTEKVNNVRFTPLCLSCPFLSEITQPEQSPEGPKNFAGELGERTTAGKRRSSDPAQKQSVGLRSAHTILNANAPTGLVVFDTNSCPSQTLASVGEMSLRCGSRNP